MKNLFYLSTVVLFFLVACSNDSSSINEITLGMSAAEVEKALGAPSKKIKLAEGPEGTIEIWHYESNGEITSAIQITANKVSQVITDFKKQQDEVVQSIQRTE